MKIYWNSHAKEILDKIYEKILNWTLQSWFFLLSWPANIGKKTLILNMIDKLGVLPQDMLVIEDPGKIDWKLYQIRVDVPDKDQILLVGDKKFINYWARQIQDFISTTPFGNYKIILIENIERLNISAANALLKTFEEPPVNTFIFATTSNKTKILSTILSRAFLINFYPLTYNQFVEFIKTELPDLSNTRVQILYAISAGRIGLAKNLLSQKDGSLNILEIIEEFIQLEEKTSDVFGRFSLIKELIQSDKIYVFLDSLIFYYNQKKDFEKVNKLIFIKQAVASNVNIENLFFNYLIN